MDKYFMWIHYERLYNHNKAKHNKTVCIFLGIYCNVQISKQHYGPSSAMLPLLQNMLIHNVRFKEANLSNKVMGPYYMHRIDRWLTAIKLHQIWYTLQWRHNGCDSVSNHQPQDRLLNRLLRRRSKKTSKLRVTGLWTGNSSGTDELPAQMASNAEKVSIWWRHYECNIIQKVIFYC